MSNKGYTIYFFIYTICILLFSLLVHPIDNETYEMYEKNRFWQPFSILTIAVIYGVFFIKNSKFYQDNKFYCSLMYFTVTTVVLSTTYFLNREIVHHENHQGNNLIHIAHTSVKVWEVGSYLLTLIYTYWLWYRSDKGTEILDEIEKTKKRFGMYRIAPSLFILFIIVVLHTVLIFSNIWWLKGYEILVTLILIILTYIIFNSITKQVVKTTSGYTSLTNGEKEKQEVINKEFKITLKYIERPTLIIFCILFAYASYCTLCGIIHEMETFFSGAIAFELLLSSIVWANTETV